MWAAIFDGSYAFEGVEGTNSEYFFWIPLLGPLIGGAAGKLKNRNTYISINSFFSSWSYLSFPRASSLAKWRWWIETIFKQSSCRCWCWNVKARSTRVTLNRVSTLWTHFYCTFKIVWHLGIWFLTFSVNERNHKRILKCIIWAFSRVKWIKKMQMKYFRSSLCRYLGCLTLLLDQFLWTTFVPYSGYENLISLHFNFCY